MTTYSLIVENKSILTGSICVYQRDPQQRINRNLYSLAWFSKMCHPNTTVEFSWSIDYCFNWAETGALRPGVLFSASESLAADPSLVDATKTIAFNYSSGAFRFVQAQEITDPGMLRIITDNTIPNKKASIGIGMSGQPAFATDAGPNLSYSFIPHPQYYVAFGYYLQGEVIDLNLVSSTVCVEYEDNIFERTVRLKSNNTWDAD